MITVPALMPETTPFAAPTVAIDVLVLPQAPPATEFVSVFAAPVHTGLLPLIVPGVAATVTVVLA